jgi:hypothetical protein
MQVPEGWQIIAVPVVPADLRATVLFPGAGSAFFAYDNGYAERETLALGAGYWVRFNSSATLTVIGAPVTLDTIDVVNGWNLVGSLSAPVAAAAVTSLPPGIVALPFYEFADGYVGAPTLEPMKGYWVRCTAPGKLILRMVASNGVSYR